MSDWKVNAVYQTVVDLISSDGQRFNSDIKCFYDSTNSQLQSEEILPGQVYTFVPDRYFYLALTPKNLISIKTVLRQNNLKPWLSSLYCYTRFLQYEPNQFSKAMILSIIDLYLLQENQEPINKLEESLPQSSGTVAWYKTLKDQSDYKTIFGTIIDYSDHLNKIISEFATNFISHDMIASAFNLKLKIISLPHLTIEIINPKGGNEVNLIVSGNDNYMVYTYGQAYLMSQNPNRGLVKSLNKLNSQTIELKVDSVKKVLENEKEKSLLIKEAYVKTVQSLIDQEKIDTMLFQYVNALANIGVDPNPFNVAIRKKICSKCLQVKNLKELTCGHLYCSDCLENLILTANNGFFILNIIEKEKENRQPPKCSQEGCGVEIIDEFLATIFEDYNKYVQQAEDRIDLRCKCGTSGKLNKFMIRCRHICNDCLHDILRENKKTCPGCKKNFSDEDNTKYRGFTKMCEGCGNYFNIVKGFMKKMCKHDLCVGCISMCTDDKCMVDDKPFDNTHGIDLKTVLRKKCVKCNAHYDRMSSYEIGKKCECSICEDCQALNFIEKCCICQYPFSEYLLNKLKEKKGDLTKVIYKMCPICQTDCDMKEMHCLVNCDHYICNNCFKANVEYLLAENQIDMISKCPQCFIKIYDAQLERMITGEAFDKVNFYSLQSAGIRTIKCPKCRLEFIPGIERRVTCLNPSCNFAFCKECEQEFHDKGNCQDKFIEERIKDLEALNDPEGISQCPNCRLPYIKDPHCDHVKCLAVDCGIEFCFRGACLRSPTLEHGNHYHRPQCKWYSPYDGHDDKIEKKCSECNRLGKKCNPPKDLRVPRRVEPDETIIIAQI